MANGDYAVYEMEWYNKVRRVVAEGLGFVEAFQLKDKLNAEVGEAARFQASHKNPEIWEPQEHCPVQHAFAYL